MTTSSPPTASAAATIERPDYIAESFWDKDKGAPKPEFGAHYKELAGFKAAEDSRRLTLPQKVEDYELALPKDFKAPEGIEFAPDDKHPLLPQARNFALKHGLSQEGFSELMALYAAREISEQQGLANFKAAEVGKLGPAGSSRKTAVDNFIASVPGVTADDAKVFSVVTSTAKQVEVLEKIMAHMRNQGVGSMTQQHREAPKAASPSDEEWARMSHAARKDYAQRHDQSAFKAA